MPLKNNILLLAIIALSFTLAACSSSNNTAASKKNMDPNKGRYSLRNDKMPLNPPNVEHVPNATPKYEPYSRRGNKPYTVYGESYSVMNTDQGFTETGRASWYGEKFHGYETSNGEPYDMYSMSGAHKTLPLPSYAKITNLDNNKQVIIRINDRGPFHSDRILDVSYAAAYKLGMLGTGTARIKLDVIYVGSLAATNSAVASAQDSGNHYIQLVASKDQLKLKKMAKELEQKYQVQSRVQAANNMYRLQLGPIGQPELADRLLNKVKQDGYPEGYMVLE
ncbi:septal ring lytic transglycosylase RlpA family protein [Shewanella sp. CG12_big_fil_rev_8_21_14_0_65_47_15]|uniref:septal ring lytic transglycosylase RlpA family protein n=1 Tax=Shewanella sp. CG12_big_fil_rev_8_21_14_0_65_47_15 TaxID=1975537 RepID=UPI000CBC0F47|nr:septal ring lytic transglycosylase RlpA family protein [Shewanella sp. CG12_big_fil_rev_8_21_14_0_65_47_15]PIW59008.1 MAG: septal ring lytic transglycosylase RlpA [Shewanella sp. CG12_big_fil_rev_8_21_14_0_65_47_15]